MGKKSCGPQFSAFVRNFCANIYQVEIFMMEIVGNWFENETERFPRKVIKYLNLASAPDGVQNNIWIPAKNLPRFLFPGPTSGRNFVKSGALIMFRGYSR